MSAEDEGVPAGQYDEAHAWRDNYDGMFWRWAECDAERLALKQELETLRIRARVTPPAKGDA